MRRQSGGQAPCVDDDARVLGLLARVVEADDSLDHPGARLAVEAFALAFFENIERS